jgi:hypothetical protein
VEADFRARGLLGSPLDGLARLSSDTLTLNQDSDTAFLGYYNLDNNCSSADVKLSQGIAWHRLSPLQLTICL